MNRQNTMSSMAQSFLSEREMNNLIRQCNQMLEKSTVEQDELKGSIQNLSKKSVQLNLENQDLFKKYREIKKENDEKEFILNEKKRSLEYYFALVEALEKQNNYENIDLDFAEDQDYKNALENQSLNGNELEELKRKIKQKIQLQLTIEQLEGYQSELDFESEKLKQMNSTWTCVRCGTVLAEGKNQKTCVFHPGKLKYYSCRQCGADEYFTCCNKCRKCQIGCQTGLHKP